MNKIETSNTDINRIRQLFSPPNDLSTFNPGKYFNEMEFSNPSQKYSSKDANCIVQMIFYCDYLALTGKSNVRDESIIYGDTSFFATLRTNFIHLEGWDEVEQIIKQQNFLYYTDLVAFLFRFFKPEPIRK